MILRKLVKSLTGNTLVQWSTTSPVKSQTLLVNGMSSTPAEFACVLYMMTSMKEMN